MNMELQSKDMRDEDLVAASRQGDRNAYAALVRRHAKRVYAVCLGMLGNTADTEDVVQETFVKAMTSLHTLRDTGRFAGWISQIARNLCRDHWRRQNRRREFLEGQFAADVPSPDDFADLHAALERLPEEHRLPLMLFYFDGKSTEKLAQELNMTRAGACTRLFRARNELRRLLSEQETMK
jgi:RNA polymerase sigma-70 factor (ECF subfamily)